MSLFVNQFEDGALLEPSPQGDTPIPVELGEEDLAVLQGLIADDDISRALAQLFLAGVRHRETTSAAS
jgi:hypothetical protein